MDVEWRTVQLGLTCEPGAARDARSRTSALPVGKISCPLNWMLSAHLKHISISFRRKFIRQRPSPRRISSRFASPSSPTRIARFFAMAQRGSDYLVWVDLEMTGLNLSRDRIIEMAVIVTDKDLNIVAHVRPFFPSALLPHVSFGLTSIVAFCRDRISSFTRRRLYWTPWTIGVRKRTEKVD